MSAIKAVLPSGRGYGESQYKRAACTNSRCSGCLRLRPTFLTRPQHRLELRKRQQLVFRLRLLRRWSAGHQEVTEVLRRSETSIMVRATLHDLALFRQVLAPGAQRVLDRAHRAIEHGAHFLPFVAYELGNQLPALGRVRFSGGEGASDPFGFGDIGDGGTRGIGSAKTNQRSNNCCNSAGSCVV